VGSCDAPSQKGAGDALVARWFSGFPEGVKKCDEGVAATLWLRGVTATCERQLRSSG